MYFLSRVLRLAGDSRPLFFDAYGVFIVFFRMVGVKSGKDFAQWTIDLQKVSFRIVKG